MEILSLLFVAFMGLVLGSFATALAHRLPRGLSLVRMKRSQCPACRHDLAVPDLFPLFSWAILKGKCRYCSAPIGWHYPVIEMMTAALCLVFYMAFGLRLETFAVFALAPVIVSLMDIDLRHKIIPDGLNLAILLTGIAALSVNSAVAADPVSFLLTQGGQAVEGVLLYGMGSLLLRQGVMLALKREPMGLGDVKFFTAAGFWLGPNPEAAALFMILAGLCGITLALIWKKTKGDPEVPFGPSLMAAFISALCIYPPDFMGL